MHKHFLSKKSNKINIIYNKFKFLSFEKTKIPLIQIAKTEFLILQIYLI